MIISASRRTDIPSYYSEWFFNRISEGYALVRNPFNPRKIRKISLSPDAVECIVFWTKNPKPMLEKLSLLEEYPYYFQFTVTAYAKDIETGVPQKREIIDTFRRLADMIGPRKVLWRYDPILLNEKYTVAYHEENFGRIIRLLNGYTEKVTISFIDFYAKIANAMSALNIGEISLETKTIIAKKLSDIAGEYRLSVDTCAENIDLSEFGITRARCIDDRLIERITGKKTEVRKDKNQRPECGCVSSVDIGSYNSCANGCLYCYANHNRKFADENMRNHNPLSPLLIGGCTEWDAGQKEFF